MSGKESGGFPWRRVAVCAVAITVAVLAVWRHVDRVANGPMPPGYVLVTNSCGEWSYRYENGLQSSTIEDCRYDAVGRAWRFYRYEQKIQRCNDWAPVAAVEKEGGQ